MRQPVTVLLAEDAHSRVRVRGHNVRVMRVERRVEDGVRLGIHRRVENPVDQVFAREAQELLPFLKLPPIVPASGDKGPDASRAPRAAVVAGRALADHRRLQVVAEDERRVERNYSGG